VARRRQSRDWQERAFEDAEFQRKDRAGGIPSDLPNPLKVTADLPRRPSWRWTAIGLVVLVFAALIHNGLSNHPPKLATSCTTPAMVLSTSSTHKGSLVRWSTTGPANAHFVIFIGTAALVPGAKPGQLHPVPDPGGNPGTTEGAALNAVLSAKCTAHGEFSVGVPPGDYNVRMFTLTGSGATVAGTVVATKTLTVKS
jgi:hypothetical protein